MPRACLLTLAVVIVLTGCGGSDAPTATPKPGELVELTTADPLRQAFAENEGQPTLLLLLSPT